jgi:hypothetical protein
MLADAEAFVGDITADGEYPHELVVDRVTRYRPEGVRVGSVVPGSALLHDMTAFILRLSRRDPVQSSLRGGALHAADVAHALNVSARTLARFRSDGLVMHHVRDAGGPVRVACFPDALQAFRERAAARVDRAGRTVRMGADARAELRSRAVELCAVGGRVSLHAIATRLAPVFGCSVRAARGVLEVDAVVVAAVRAAQRVGEPAAQRVGRPVATRVPRAPLCLVRRVAGAKLCATQGGFGSLRRERSGLDVHPRRWRSGLEWLNQQRRGRRCAVAWSACVRP